VRSDRDTILIGLTLLPIGFMIYVSYRWHVDGTFPVSLFNWAVPNVPLPPFPTIVLPGIVVATWEQYAKNGVAVSASLVIGLAAGIIVIGAVTDGVMTLSRLMNRQPAAPEVTELQLPDVPKSEPYILG
jgi:hypothetical protein